MTFVSEYSKDVYDDIYGDLAFVGAETRDTLTWRDADGNLYPLSGDITVLEGVNGLRSPPTRRTYETVAGQQGSRRRNAAYENRSAELPVMFEGGSEQDLRNRMRAWEHRFDLLRGDGALLVDTVDDKHLYTPGVMVDGLQGNEDGSHRFEHQPIRLAVLVFEGDPFWYEQTAATATWALGGTTAKWFDPPSKSILPITLGASSIGGTFTLLVDGQLDVYPVWTITGPASSLTLTNQTTGRNITWAGVLDAGEQLVIDTRPGAKTVLQNGLPAFAFLQSWDMWPLVPGADSVTADVQNATAATRATVSWNPAWLGY